MQLTIDIEAEDAPRPDLAHLLELIMYARIGVAEVDVGPLAQTRVVPKPFDKELSQARDFGRGGQARFLHVAADLEKDRTGVLGFVGGREGGDRSRPGQAAWCELREVLNRNDGGGPGARRLS
jgi:hypothetical protein